MSKAKIESAAKAYVYLALSRLGMAQHDVERVLSEIEHLTNEIKPEEASERFEAHLRAVLTGAAPGERAALLEVDGD